MTSSKRKAAEGAYSNESASSDPSTRQNRNKRSKNTPAANVLTRREIGASSNQRASSGIASSGGSIFAQRKPHDRNEENRRAAQTNKRNSASSATTRSQAANAKDQERSGERPLDPNNPDDTGDSGAGGSGGVAGGNFAPIDPPSPSRSDLFSNRDFLGMLSLYLEPSELYVCQRVCSLWRDQFSNLFLMRNSLDKRVTETYPLVPSAIRQRREMVLAVHTLTEAYDNNAPVAKVSSHLQKLRNFNVTEELLDVTGILKPVKDFTQHMVPAIRKLASKVLSEWAIIVEQQKAAGMPRVLQRFAKIRSDLSFAELARSRMSARMGRPTSMLLHSFDDLLVKTEPSYTSNLYSRAQRERLACFSSGRFAFIATSTRGRTRQSMGNIYTSKNMDFLRAQRPNVMEEDFFKRLTAPVSFTSVIASKEMVVGISEDMDETRIYAFECALGVRMRFTFPPGLVLWRVLVSRKTILVVVGSGLGQRSLQHWTYDENKSINFLTPLNLSFDPKTTVVLNDQPILKADKRPAYQPSFDLISIDEGKPPNWNATIQQRHYALDGTNLNADVNIPIPELAGTHFTFSIDHTWHFTPLVKKTLIPVLPDADEVPNSFVGGIDLSYYHTLELTCESATAKLSYRLLPHIDLNFLRLAYLGDDIWFCQKVPKPNLDLSPPKEEGDIWVMEILGAPKATVETRKSEIVDILSESLKSRGVARDDLNRQMSAFKGPGILLADPTTGMLMKINDDITLSIFSFWSTSRFVGDNNDDGKSYNFHARRAAWDRAQQRLREATG